MAENAAITPARARVLTVEVAKKLAAILLGPDGVTHNWASACAKLLERDELHVHPDAVRQCLHRYENGECGEDMEAAAAILWAAKQEHVRQIRALGWDASAEKNGAGVAYAKWQAEVQDPRNHPRTQSVELTGKDGGPVQTQDVSKLPLEQLLALARGEGGEGEEG